MDGVGGWLGWVAGLTDTKANSAFKLSLILSLAELGNTNLSVIKEGVWVCFNVVNNFLRFHKQKHVLNSDNSMHQG